jgi:hypothetical protein
VQQAFNVSRLTLAIVFSCLIAGCSGTVPQGKSTGDKEAQSTRSKGKLAPMESKPETSDVLLTFVGEVKSCVPLATIGAGGAGALTVSNDPRYVVTVAVVAVPKEDPLLRPGANFALAIHSPSRLFLGDWREAVGKRFTFRLHGTSSDGQRRFFHVDAAGIKPGEQTPGNAEKSHK